MCGRTSETVAYTGPMPRIIPEPRYFSMPSIDVGADVRRKRALNCCPWVGSLTHSPDAVIHSPAEMTAAWPMTVTRLRCPCACAWLGPLGGVSSQPPRQLLINAMQALSRGLEKAAASLNSRLPPSLIVDHGRRCAMGATPSRQPLVLEPHLQAEPDVEAALD